MTPIFVEKLYFPRCRGGTGTLPETDMFAEAWWLESMKFGVDRWPNFQLPIFPSFKEGLKKTFLPFLLGSHFSIIWGFPKIVGFPPNHPIKRQGFPIIYKPSILGDFHPIIFWETPPYGKPPHQPTWIGPLPRLEAWKIWVNIHRSRLTSTRKPGGWNRGIPGMMDDQGIRGDIFEKVNIWSPGFCSDFLLLVWSDQKGVFFGCFSNKTMLSDRKKVWLVYEIYIITITKQ